MLLNFLKKLYLISKKKKKLYLVLMYKKKNNNSEFLLIIWFSFKKINKLKQCSFISNIFKNNVINIALLWWIRLRNTLIIFTKIILTINIFNPQMAKADQQYDQNNRDNKNSPHWFFLLLK